MPHRVAARAATTAALAAPQAVGQVRELRPGTVEPVGLAFCAARGPWCPECS
jgi:hypothetical protein